MYDVAHSRGTRALASSHDCFQLNESVARLFRKSVCNLWVTRVGNIAPDADQFLYQAA